MCPTLCSPMDCSLSGFSVHGILQARILVWVAFPPPTDLPEPGIKPASPVSPVLQADSLSTEPIFTSVQSLSCVQLLQHTRPPCPSPTPRVHPNSCPSSWGCHPAISSSVVPFSSCPQSLPASGYFSISQFFESGGQILEFQFQHQSFQ